MNWNAWLNSTTTTHAVSRPMQGTSGRMWPNSQRFKNSSQGFKGTSSLLKIATRTFRISNPPFGTVTLTLCTGSMSSTSSWSRALLGSEVEASIDLTGQRLQVKVQVGGQAMESLKTLAFDLTAMLTSLEGRA